MNHFKSREDLYAAPLQRAEEIMAGGGVGPSVDLPAEYSALTESYRALLNQFDKTLLISDSYQSQLLELNARLSQQVEEETEKRLLHDRNFAQNAKVAAMGEMLGVIAHQWRQPLAALAMIIQRLVVLQEEGMLSASEVYSTGQRAMEQIRHMSETIDEFRYFYSPNRLCEDFSPGDKLNETIQVVAPQFAERGIKIELTVTAAEDRQLYGYPNQFKQALINLLANAREAIQELKELEGENFVGRIAIDLSTNEQRCCIAIHDNGSGVPTALATTLFDPFVTSKNSSGGSGIGLFIVRTIVTDGFKGELNYRSQPGDTTFSISLPFPQRGLR